MHHTDQPLLDSEMSLILTRDYGLGKTRARNLEGLSRVLQISPAHVNLARLFIALHMQLTATSQARRVKTIITLTPRELLTADKKKERKETDKNVRQTTEEGDKVRQIF